MGLFSLVTHAPTLEHNKVTLVTAYYQITSVNFGDGSPTAWDVCYRGSSDKRLHSAINSDNRSDDAHPGLFLAEPQSLDKLLNRYLTSVPTYCNWTRSRR